MIKLSNYGEKGVFLESKGWVIKPIALPKGTAACDASRKTIWMIPKAYNMSKTSPNVRILQYVVRHEIWHALHAELMNYECSSLMWKNNLKKWSAVEVVAEAGCLHDENSRRMRRWVQLSTAWHGKVGYKYSFRDVVSPEAKAIIDNLNRMIKFPPPVGP